MKELDEDCGNVKRTQELLGLERSNLYRKAGGPEGAP
ncbi:MAG: hypothetical protein FJW37_07480 [Acidobacteria bacterium]|nr:hypothetical protein [Acidobacteriota bacterium]